MKVDVIEKIWKPSIEGWTYRIYLRDGDKEKLDTILDVVRTRENGNITINCNENYSRIIIHFNSTKGHIIDTYYKTNFPSYIRKDKVKTIWSEDEDGEIRAIYKAATHEMTPYNDIVPKRREIVNLDFTKQIMKYIGHTGIYPKKFIFNYPMTIAIWPDGKKTYARTNGDHYTPEYGMLLCLIKYYLGEGGTSKLNKIFDAIDEAYDPIDLHGTLELDSEGNPKKCS